MAPKKNPGLSARQGTVQAAIAAANETAALEPKKSLRRTRGEDDVPLSIRLPKVVHDELRRLNFEKRRPIHGMILEGIGLFLEHEGASEAALEALR